MVLIIVIPHKTMPGNKHLHIRKNSPGFAPGIIRQQKEQEVVKHLPGVIADLRSLPGSQQQVSPDYSASPTNKLHLRQEELRPQAHKENLLIRFPEANLCRSKSSVECFQFRKHTGVAIIQ